MKKKSKKSEPLARPVDITYGEKSIGGIEVLPIEKLEVSPLHPRKRAATDPDVLELAKSIGQLNLLHPILVRPLAKTNRYEVGPGQGRFLAHQVLGRKTIAARIVHLDDKEWVLSMAAENRQRKDPDLLEEANWLNGLESNADFALSIDDWAAALGKTRSWVILHRRLARLPKEIQKHRNLFPDNVLIRMAFGSEPQLKELIRLAAENQWDEPWRAEEIESVFADFEMKLKGALFDTARDFGKVALPHPGPCLECPMNSATMPDLFEVKGELGTCQNRPCFKSKAYLTMAEVVNDILAKPEDRKDTRHAVENVIAEYAFPEDLAKRLKLGHIHIWSDYQIQKPEKDSQQAVWIWNFRTNKRQKGVLPVITKRDGSKQFVDEPEGAGRKVPIKDLPPEEQAKAKLNRKLGLFWKKFGLELPDKMPKQLADVRAHECVRERTAPDGQFTSITLLVWCSMLETPIPIIRKEVALKPDAWIGKPFARYGGDPSVSAPQTYWMNSMGALQRRLNSWCRTGEEAMKHKELLVLIANLVGVDVPDEPRA